MRNGCEVIMHTCAIQCHLLIWLDATRQLLHKVKRAHYKWWYTTLWMQTSYSKLHYLRLAGSCWCFWPFPLLRLAGGVAAGGGIPAADLVAFRDATRSLGGFPGADFRARSCVFDVSAGVACVSPPPDLRARSGFVAGWHDFVAVDVSAGVADNKHSIT